MKCQRIIQRLSWNVLKIVEEHEMFSHLSSSQKNDYVAKVVANSIMEVERPALKPDFKNMLAYNSAVELGHFGYIDIDGIWRSTPQMSGLMKEIIEDVIQEDK